MVYLFILFLQWDHLVQLFVCCEDPLGRFPPCSSCAVTPWMSSHHQHHRGDHTDDPPSPPEPTPAPYTPTAAANGENAAFWLGVTGGQSSSAPTNNITVNAQTNADANAIANEIAWAMAVGVAL